MKLVFLILVIFSIKIQNSRTMNPKQLLALSIFLYFSLPTFAQTPEIDSLKNIVQNEALPDTTRIYAKGQWAYELWRSNVDSIKLLAEQSLLEAEKLNYTNGIAIAKKALGNYYSEKGEYEQSLQSHLEAIDLFRTLDNQK